MSHRELLVVGGGVAAVEALLALHEPRPKGSTLWSLYAKLACGRLEPCLHARPELRLEAHP